MGKFQSGILGGFSGKVGTVVGSNWRGIEYMRHKRRRTKKPATAAQLDQRAKFGAVMRFVGTLNPLLMRSFKGNPQKTGANIATAYILDKAVTGTYPAYTVDYSQALISQGNLQNANLPAVVTSPSGLVGFSWMDNSGVSMANATDKALLVVYCPADNLSVFTAEGAVRADGNASIAVPNFTGKRVHTWLSFVSADGSEYSSSIYTGTVTVA